MEEIKKAIEENPIAIKTAIVGLILFGITKLLGQKIPEEIIPYINVTVGIIITGLLGRFTRLTKTEAKILGKIEDNKNQI